MVQVFFIQLPLLAKFPHVKVYFLTSSKVKIFDLSSSLYMVSYRALLVEE